MSEKNRPNKTKPKQIFLSGLHPSVTLQELQAAISRNVEGPCVTNITMPLDHDNPAFNKKIAFITPINAEIGEKIIAGMQGRVLGNRNITCHWSKDTQRSVRA
jgi:hypothetical protein